MMHGVMMPLAMFEEIMARWEEGLEGDLGAGGTPLAGGPRAQVEEPTASNTTRFNPSVGQLGRNRGGFQKSSGGRK